MPSANTVAQKPAGNSSPLSSLGHDGVWVPLPELDWLGAGAIGSIRYNTTTKDNRTRFTRSRRIEPSGDRLRRIPRTILLHFSCSYSRSTSQFKRNLRWEDRGRP